MFQSPEEDTMEPAESIRPVVNASFSKATTGRAPRMQLSGIIVKPRPTVEDEREVWVYRYLLIELTIMF